MAKYRKKPVEIEAVQWTGRNRNEICSVVNRADLHSYGWNDLYIETLDGVIHAEPDDYIIKGVNGKLYRCKPDIFEKFYERVEEREPL